MKADPSSQTHHRIADFIRDYWTDVTFPIGGILVTLATYLFSNDAIGYWSQIQDTQNPIYARYRFWAIFLGAVGLVITLISLIFHFLKQKRVTVLEETIKQRNERIEELESQLKLEASNNTSVINSFFEDISAITDGFCVNMGHALGFGSKSKVYERISIYLMDYEAGCFVLFSRHSESMHLKSKGHSSYENIGILSKVWNDTFCFENDYPPYDNKKNKEKYHKMALKDGFTEEKVKKIRMKAQLYAGWRVADSRGHPIAVVLIEANNPGRWDEIFIKNFFESQSQQLTSLFEIILPRIPTVSSARRKGF